MDERLRAFYTDADTCVTEPEGLVRALQFIDELAAIGIEQSQIAMDDFTLFAHSGLTESIQGFIQDRPFDPPPLESVKIVQFVRADSVREDLQTILDGLKAHQSAMATFSRRYNIEVILHVYLEGLDASLVGEVASFTRSDAVDELGLFYQFSEHGQEGPCYAESLRGDLDELLKLPVMKHPNVRLGNFPFCFYPEAGFTAAYRDVVSGLKGRIGGQRQVIREVQKTPHAFHSPCRSCRCRQACYHFTDVGEHPEIGEGLAPRTTSTLVFAGGSIREAEVEPDEDRVWTRPVEQGDMLAAVLEGFETILIIDGYFHTKFPCTTLEVMLAIEQGVNVFGSSSMGALRAVELEVYGMTGVGDVFDTLKAQDIKGYHLVAQTYTADDRPLTVPLIEVQGFLACARDAQVINSAFCDEAFALAEQIHFMDLTWRTFLKRVDSPALSEFFEQHGADAFRLKRHDAMELLSSYKTYLANRQPGWVKQHYQEMKERMLVRLFSKYDETPDRSLPDDWRESGVDGVFKLSTGERVNHDFRSSTAKETIRRARAFFADMHVPVAETTHYDQARASCIISTFLIPFYFLDYYPSSATGNGATRDEAEASAWMELLERASVCGMHIRDHAEGDWADPSFPVEQLPQYINWGTQVQVKQHLTELHGRVRVSDIATGKKYIVPKFVTMFHYSGTDGYASGNTREEAILYALYELIERDTCQMMLRDADVRNGLADQLVATRLLDEDSQEIIRLAGERGCRMLVFLLPNLYGLPCVMVQVYDELQRVQVHGGVAVRADFQSAAASALHEAWMQYITYYAGTRDDYQPFAPMKRAAIGYANARAMYFDESGITDPAAIDQMCFRAAEPSGVAASLDHVMQALLDEDIEHILVADTSPKPEFKLSSVKVIVPRLELWFCPKYQPSPFFAERVERLKSR